MIEVRDQGEANTMALDQNGDWLAVIKQNGELSVQKQTANMYLWAAAPLLLSALKKALPELKELLAETGHDPSVGVDSSHLIYLIDQAEEAVAVAEMDRNGIRKAIDLETNPFEPHNQSERYHALLRILHGIGGSHDQSL